MSKTLRILWIAAIHSALTAIPLVGVAASVEKIAKSY
jgi:hypothetical protein